MEGFLQNEGITALSAPPGQRKTLILLNVARSLLTGDALFGKFKVLEQADLIVYLRMSKRRKDLLSTDADNGGVLAVHAINQTV